MMVEKDTPFSPLHAPESREGVVEPLLRSRQCPRESILCHDSTVSHKTVDTRKRELRSLAKAMTELDMKDAIIVTHEEEGETPVNGGTVRIIPAWRFLLEMT